MKDGVCDLLVEQLAPEKGDLNYTTLRQKNLERQYAFLQSVTEAAVNLEYARISHGLIKALNFHATACLNPCAGRYRTTPIVIRRAAGQPLGHQPPSGEEVRDLMDGFVATVNDDWEHSDPVDLATLCVWRLNHIHPFKNGNGRTARALCYYVLCAKLGGLLPGSPMLPERIRATRVEYVRKLQEADEGSLTPLAELVQELLTEQMAGG
ncbi:MAG: Fic family protein [Chloroflexi bacterium]|nr:Fic family protein [Chloroflexota bacterium]